MATKVKTHSKVTKKKNVTKGQIELKAYEIFMERIKHNRSGNAESDWIHAENELRD